MFAFFKAIPFTSCGHVSSSGNLPKIIPWKQVSKFPKLTTVLDSPSKQALKIQACQFKSNTKKHTIQIQTLNWFTQKHTQTDVNYFQYHQILINRERKAVTCEGFGEEDPRSSYGTKGQLRSSWGKPAFSRENSAQFSRKKMNQIYFRVSSSLFFSLNSPGGLKLKQFQTHAVLNFS